MRLVLPLIVLLLGSCAGPKAPSVTDAWIAAAPPNAPVRGGYLTINNPDRQDWTLSAVRSPAFGRVEMHEMRHVDGMMRMRQIESIPVAAGQSVRLEPGHLHLMLMQARQALAVGDSIRLELDLRDSQGQSQTLSIQASVKALNH